MEAVQAAEVTTNVHQLAPEVVIDGPGAEKIKGIEEQIRDHQDAIDKLEVQRQKSVVEELTLEPEALAAVAKHRQKERYPNAWKEVEKHLKSLAWSGERVAYLEPSSPIFNDWLIRDLKKEGFSASIIKLGANQGFKIEVKW